MNHTAFMQADEGVEDTECDLHRVNRRQYLVFLEERGKRRRVVDQFGAYERLATAHFVIEQHRDAIHRGCLERRQSRRISVAPFARRQDPVFKLFDRYPLAGVLVPCDEDFAQGVDTQ